MVSVSNCDLIASNVYMGNENYYTSSTQCTYWEVSALSSIGRQPGSPIFSMYGLSLVKVHMD